jgi:cytochrome P450
MTTLAPATAAVPPLVQGLPILGNALDMSNDMIPFLVKSYQQFGPVFRVRALNQELIVLAGPEANTFVTQEGTDKLRSHEAWTPYNEEFGITLSMVNSDGDQHLRLRKLFKPYFSQTNLLSDIPRLIGIAQRAIDQLPDSAEISALALCRAIVTDQLGQALANYSPANDIPHMVRTIRTALNVLTVGKWPRLMLRNPRYRRARRQFIKMGQKIVQQHRAGLVPQDDMISAMLQASQSGEFQEAFGEEAQIVLMALSPFVAGLDTAANECTFMLYELLHHPDIMAQCVADADRIFADGIPDHQRFKTAEALHHAMMETLRCHSIAPGIDRTAAQSFDFGGYHIAEGQRVFIATTVAHFLPELYADPLAFDITRYSEPRKEHKQKGAYAPFGVGTHICLGAGAAEAQIILVTAILLHTLEIEAVNPTAHLGVKIDPTPTLGMKFKVRVTKRRHGDMAAPDPAMQPIGG